jgi:hypothetical protein
MDDRLWVIKPDIYFFYNLSPITYHLIFDISAGFVYSYFNQYENRCTLRYSSSTYYRGF